jgi:hypothetical protein
VIIGEICNDPDGCWGVRENADVELLARTGVATGVGEEATASEEEDTGVADDEEYEDEDEDEDEVLVEDSGEVEEWLARELGAPVALADVVEETSGEDTEGEMVIRPPF